MLSAAPPPFSSRATPPPPLREVQVLYRRVCVLRASGKSVEADALESSQLAEAINRARASASASPGTIEHQLEALFVSENERVDTAHALAELLLPMLTAAEESVPLRRSRVLPDFERPRETPTAPTPVDDTGAEGGQAASNGNGPMLPGIADFIDEMLVQERVSHDPRTPRRNG